MTITRREKVTLLLGGAVAAAALLVTTVFEPLAGAWRETRAALDEALGRLAALEGRAEKARALLVRRQRLVADLGSLLGPAEPAARSGSAADTPPGAYLRLEAYLERTAKSAEVKLRRLTVVPSPDGQGGAPQFRAVVCDLAFDTNAQGLVRFLHVLEKGDRLVRIRDLTLRRDLKKGDALEVSSMRVVGYVPGAKG